MINVTLKELFILTESAVRRCSSKISKNSFFHRTTLVAASILRSSITVAFASAKIATLVAASILRSSITVAFASAKIATCKN